MNPSSGDSCSECVALRGVIGKQIIRAVARRQSSLVKVLALPAGSGLWGSQTRCGHARAPHALRRGGRALVKVLALPVVCKREAKLVGDHARAPRALWRGGRAVVKVLALPAL